MTDTATLGAYGVLTEPATLKIERLLPGPVERVWSYLTQSDLRRQWMAAGAMDMKLGAPFEFVWRNEELSTPTGKRPPNFPEEHRMQGTITELDPPHKLGITWGSTGGVTFTLAPQGENILLTVLHRRIVERDMRLNISAGWHAHLDVLAARLRGEEPAPFWDSWRSLRTEYDQRLPS